MYGSGHYLTTMEKSDFEASEKDSNTDVDKGNSQINSVDKLSIDSLFYDNGSLKIINIQSQCPLTDKDVSPTNCKGMACESEMNITNRIQNDKETGKRKIKQYDQQFLISCKDSPLTNCYPPEIEDFPDILVPLDLPRRHGRLYQQAASSDTVLEQSVSDILCSSDSLPADTNDSRDNDGENDDEVLDFDFLLEENVSTSKEECKVENINTTNKDSMMDKHETINEVKIADKTIPVDEGQNDLNAVGNQEHVEHVMELNIPTDSDDVDGEDEDISLWEFQKELAEKGSQGENVIVLAPTNSGKTRVACRIMQVHLRRQRRLGRIGKVVFLVENEALAFQQGKVCGELLPAYRTKVITGSIQRDKKQLLMDFIRRRDILVVTAQVLLNALNRKELSSLEMFSMIVFDECHHTGNQHHFNEIMRKYMDLKIKKLLDHSSLPQIVGLTASLGVGGNTDPFSAMNHMKGILANLDAKYLCTVRHNIEDLDKHENNPKENIITVDQREYVKFGDAILDIMDKIDNYMRGHPSMSKLPEKDKLLKSVCQVPPSRGTEQFLQWASEFREAIAKISSDSARRMLNPCRRHLKVYNKAILVHTDARIKDAQEILEIFMNREMEIAPENETDKALINFYIKDLKARDFSAESENPKLVEMHRLLMNEVGCNENARVIIFVKSRELARALIKWMHETEQLKPLNASEFVGQVASVAKGGMTKCGQKDVLEYFKNGLHKVIVATSVAEEGLDIRKCNLVIRYEYVTNEIVRVQSRGRARAGESKYIVLTTKGSWIAEKEEKNATLEKLMNIIVPKLQAFIENDPNAWENEMREIQEKQKSIEEMKEENRLANITDDDMILRCLNCSQFICMSSDIRVIQGSHHIVVNEDVNERLLSIRGRNPVPFGEDFISHGVIFCGNKECQSVLGGICEYRLVEFPLIVIRYFMIEDKSGESSFVKKWKKATFNMKELDFDDLKSVVRRRRCAYVKE